ncbi:MAG: type II toxin-antitoxin system RelE/ParE family toxin [Candidatus Altiarchaeota archaeon]
MKQEYTVKFDTDATEELVKLPHDISRRVYKKIIESKQDPYHYWVRLEGRTDYRIRVGDYRAIADIIENEKLIYVTKIGHRKTIYQE